MAEPTSYTFILTWVLTAILGPVLGPPVADLLGPVLGPASMITFGAVAGSMLAMGKTKTETRWSGFFFILEGVLLALAIAGVGAWVLQQYFKVPVSMALMPLGAVIGYARNAIGDLMDKMPQRLVDAVAIVINRKGDQ